MKTSWALFATAIVLVSCEREISIPPSEIPQAALTDFDTRYPSATDVEWKAEKESGHFYLEAEFKIGDEKKAVHFKADGTFVEEEK